MLENITGDLINSVVVLIFILIFANWDYKRQYEMSIELMLTDGILEYEGKMFSRKYYVFLNLLLLPIVLIASKYGIAIGIILVIVYIMLRLIHQIYFPYVAFEWMWHDDLIKELDGKYVEERSD